MNEQLEGRTWEIYHLKDPDSLEIRYVGITYSGSRHRYLGHIDSAKRGRQTHCARWIRKLLANNKYPVMEIVNSGKGPEGLTLEIEEILRCRNRGCNLTNLTLGGGGRLGIPHTVESKKKMSDSQKLVVRDRTWSKEQKLAFSKLRTGEKRSPDVVQRIRNNWKSRRPEKWKDTEGLRKMYLSEGKSTTEIAKIIGASVPMVYKLFKEYGIRRSR